MWVSKLERGKGVITPCPPLPWTSMFHDIYDEPKFINDYNYTFHHIFCVFI